MAVFRLTKEFSFEAAHALTGYDGPCRSLHGHSYRLFVTVKGEPLAVEGHPNAGMVIDFGLLKQIVCEEVIDRFDHALVLHAAADHVLIDRMKEFSMKIVELDFRPTSELLLAHFADRIGRRLPAGVQLHSLRLHETATSYAEWFAEDNR